MISIKEHKAANSIIILDRNILFFNDMGFPLFFSLTLIITQSFFVFQILL